MRRWRRRGEQAKRERENKRRGEGEQAETEREDKKYLMSRHIVRISFIFKFDIALNMFLENRFNKREYRY